MAIYISNKLISGGANDTSKMDIFQGEDNAGKVLSVDDSGNVVATERATLTIGDIVYDGTESKTVPIYGGSMSTEDGTIASLGFSQNSILSSRPEMVMEMTQEESAERTMVLL